MKAIILSAGQGRRLLPFTERIPKCIVPVQGQPLIGWQIDVLQQCGIDQISVVVGYGADQVDKLLARTCDPRHIRTLYNPFFDSADNLISCWAARIEMEEDFLLLNGDTLFEAAVLERLLDAPQHPVTLAVDCKEHYDDDDMKVIRAGERLVRVGKKLPLDEVNAESIGLMIFRGDGPRLFRETIERALRDAQALKQWYLSLIDTMADRGVVWTRSIEGLGWAEVDCPADLDRATRKVAEWAAAYERRCARA